MAEMSKPRRNPAHLVVMVVLAMLVALATSCYRVEENELIGRYVFSRDSIRIELLMKADHTYDEISTLGATPMKSSGTWKYWEGPRNLFLNDLRGPVIPLGSKTVQLQHNNFGVQVEPCGGTLCLVVSDDDSVLQFVKN
jgi:hypothetical protein